MYKWDDIQTKTELDFVFNILKEKIENKCIKRIFSFDDAVPGKNNNLIKYNTLEDPLYILFEDDYCLIIEFTNYSSIYIDYRKITPEEVKQGLGNISNKDIDYLNNYHEIHGWDFDENRNRIEESFRMKQIIEIHGNYDKLKDIQIEGFNDSYEKWISNGSSSSMITIPAGGDYFKSIELVLNNGLEISMCPQDAEMDGYYDLIIEDKNNVISYKDEKVNNSDSNITQESFDESTIKQLQDDDYNFKYPEQTVILKHLGSWYKVNFDGAYIVSFLMDYKLFEDPRYGTPTVGFPDSSIGRVVDLLRKNKINYMLKYDDDKLVDFGSDNNFDKFLHNDLPFSYVTSRGEVKKQPKGSFKVQYEGDEPEDYIIGENINSEAELVKKVENGNVGEIIKVNDFNVTIIEKNISY